MVGLGGVIISLFAGADMRIDRFFEAGKAGGCEGAKRHLGVGLDAQAKEGAGLFDAFARGVGGRFCGGLLRVGVI